MVWCVDLPPLEQDPGHLQATLLCAVRASFFLAPLFYELIDYKFNKSNLKYQTVKKRANSKNLKTHSVCLNSIYCDRGPGCSTN